MGVRSTYRYEIVFLPSKFFSLSTRYQIVTSAAVELRDLLVTSSGFVALYPEMWQL